MKKLQIIILKKYLFLLLSIANAIFILVVPIIARAEPSYAPLTFFPQVQIPVEGSVFNQASTMVGNYNSASGIMTSDLLARYIKAFYDYGMMIAGILAAIVLMGGGVLWLTSAGNDSKVTQAKELISGSVAGLIILFGSWMLLNTINPDLKDLKIIKTQVVKYAELKGGNISEDLLSDVSTYNPEVCCVQYDKDNNVIFCAAASASKCATYSASASVTKKGQIEKACVNIPDCTKNAFLVSCIDPAKPEGEQKFKDGTRCKNPNKGYCFDGMCFTGDGGKDSPCGPITGGKCVLSGTCGKGYTDMYDAGGRSCGTNYECCIIDGKIGDTCGRGDATCTATSFWGGYTCPGIIGAPSVFGRSCNGSTCCPN